jgi:hypothetical protein
MRSRPSKIPVEDGYGDGCPAPELRIRRGSYAIEHVMPQSWLRYSPLSEGRKVAEGDARIDRFGTVTLLTHEHNATVSKGPWMGDAGKAVHLHAKDVVRSRWRTSWVQTISRHSRPGKFCGHTRRVLTDG